MDVREEVNNALSALIGENVNVDFKEDFERDGIESSLVMASVIAAKLDSIANALERIGARLGRLGRDSRGLR